jgi:hypothetical protein
MFKGMDTDNHYIAGWNTPNDWAEFSKQLDPHVYSVKWGEAYSEYFLQRLELRYLHPINILQKNGTFQGEGFSIMTILCSLVEFLESTCQGKIYKFVSKPEQLKENEYSSSKRMFIEFLVNREPFKSTFDEDLAKEFYSSIRCGLLHEASTKNGWRIWASSPNGEMISQDKKIVYRDQFEAAIRTFTDEYKELLKSDASYRSNFLVKWGSL